MASKKNTFNEEQVKQIIEEGIKKLEDMDCKDKKRDKETCWFRGGRYYLVFGFYRFSSLFPSTGRLIRDERDRFLEGPSMASVSNLQLVGIS